MCAVVATGGSQASSFRYFVGCSRWTLVLSPPFLSPSDLPPRPKSIDDFSSLAGKTSLSLVPRRIYIYIYFPTINKKLFLSSFPTHTHTLQTYTTKLLR